MIESNKGHFGHPIPPSWRIVHEVDVVRMVAEHAQLRQLCDDLEACADRLPDRSVIVEATHLSATLAARLAAHESAEDPALAGLLASGPATENDVLLDRIRHRHSADHLLAEDLHDALAAATRTMGPVRGELLGYMMRCLFDGCRRGIDFQEAAILMLARGRLTIDARATLQFSLTGRR